MGEVASAKVTIVNRLGLHARPATEFVDLASSFKAEVWVHKGDDRVGGRFERVVGGGARNRRDRGRFEICAYHARSSRRSRRGARWRAAPRRTPTR